MRIVQLTTDSREHYGDYANPNPYFGAAPEALLQGFATLPEVEVHVISCVRQPVLSPKKIAPNIFYHSIVVPKIGWMRTLYSGCVRATRTKLREIQPDIVHGQGMERDCALAAARSGFPNVVTIHGNMRLIAKINQARPFSFNWLAARLETFVLPRTDGIVAITNYTRDAVSGLARRIWVLPNAVDEGFFQVQASPDWAASPVGLCVGTICHRKNQNAFIRALDSLAKERKFKIIFLGQTDNSAYSREFLELIRERSWCEHAGFADRATLKMYFQSATFAVLPTLEDNCPMVVLEAMAAGVPVLASNVGGVPDLIQPEVTGLFCNPAQPESFCTGIAQLLDDRPLVEQLITNAKAAALQRFHPQAIARQHLKIYQEVLGLTSSQARR